VVSLGFYKNLDTQRFVALHSRFGFTDLFLRDPYNSVLHWRDSWEPCNSAMYCVQFGLFARICLLVLWFEIGIWMLREKQLHGEAPKLRKEDSEVLELYYKYKNKTRNE
jgi:hypothetical protein